MPPSNVNPQARAMPSNSVDLPTPLPPVITVIGRLKANPNSATCAMAGVSTAHGGAAWASTSTR
ncbi:hypothetical protein CYJ46_10325 [Corynebacterium coyleae]|nr:hypothetical protein CYJ46_10325 [Corynebacterium coyleae]